MANPHVAVYIDGWGRKGDVGVISEDENGRPLGAAWYRVFTEEKHGYGFVQRDTPEATIAVIGEARGRGVGTALLEALICQARAGGFPALSLSVEEDNPAVALYERCGFIRFLRVEKASTMRLGL